MGTQISPCRKKVKDPLTVIIWINLVELESSMLYTKNEPQSFLGSGGEDFEVFLPYMGIVAILFKFRGIIWTNWQYLFDRRSHVKLGGNCSNGFRKEDI